MPPAGPSEKVWLEVTIADLPARFEGGSRAAVHAYRKRGEKLEPLCGAVLLTFLGEPGELRVGDRMNVHAHLRRPRNFKNPGAYDQVSKLARQGVWTVAYAQAESLVRLGREGRGWSAALADERLRIGGLIDASLPPAEAGLLRALVVGDEAGVGAELWDQIARVGLAHLLSISGLHVGIVWGVSFAALRWLGSRSEIVLLRCDVRALAASGAAIPAILYGLLAGGSVPTARSVVMTLLVVVALGCGREIRPLRTLGLAAFALALARPGSPLDVSYQLSFASVLSLFAGADLYPVADPRLAPASRRAVWGRRLAVSFLVSAAAFVGTAPLVAFHFNRVTPVGLITNPLLVAPCGLAPTLLGLAGAALSPFSETAARTTFALAYWPLHVLCRAVAFAAQVPLGCLRVPTPTLAETLLLYGLVSLPWVPPRLRRPLAALLALLLLVDTGFWLHQRFLDGDVRIRFLDVGQGDATVIELPRGRVLVVDGGGFARSHFDVGERVVARYLWTRKILHVDYLAVTHGDWDHQGGLHFLAREFSPRELWRSAPASEARRIERLAALVRGRGGIVRVLQPGEEISEGDASVRCLYPPSDETLSSNDSSLVIRVEIGSISVMLPGDIEKPAEQLLRQRPEARGTTVLKAPHHGSATSSSEALLRALHPRIVVFSVGAGNQFQFPHREVIERYARMGSRSYRTDVDGSVWLETRGGPLRVRAFSESSTAFCSGLGALC